MEKVVTLNEYHEGAMSTCLPSCENFMYSLAGMTAEVGEINDKIAKWVRKGFIVINDNDLQFTDVVASESERLEMLNALSKEVGDVLWFVTHMAEQVGKTLEEVAQENHDKLASRKQRNVIDGNGDNR